MKILSIVAWVLVVILAVGAGALAFLNHQQTVQAADLRNILAQAATAAGVEDVSAPSLKNAAMLPDLLQQVQSKVADLNLQLAAAKDAQASAQTEASGAKSEVGSLTQKLQDQTAKAEGLTKDLAAKDEEITAAKAETEKAAQSLKDAQEAADKQQADLEGTIAELKTQMADDKARMQAEIAAAQQAAAAAKEAAAAQMAPEAPAEEPAMAEAPAVETKPAASKPTVSKPAAVEESWERGGQVIGESEMFSAIRYSYKDQSLFLRLWDGQKLAYQDLPPEAYEKLIGNVNTLDMNYRFNIQSKFKSLPPDGVVVRKFWKDSRRKHYRGDVRLIEPEAAPVVEETALAAESAPAVAEAAPAVAEPAPAAEEAAPVEKAASEATGK